MTLFRPLAALLLLVAAACASTAEEPEAPSYYVMRHLQKGEGQDPPLSAEGAGNARRLIGYFHTDPPRVIYVSTTRRARETAAPLAARLRVELRTYDPADTPGLIGRVRAERGPVLIVGHSNTVPEIVERLGGKRPTALTETDYGDLWRVWGEPPRTRRSKFAP